MGLWWISDNGVNTLKGEPAFVSEDGTTFKTEHQAMRYEMVTGLPYYPWTDSNGNPPDPSNPIRLPDGFIYDSIRTVRKAREDFFEILPTLLPAEQDRLNDLLERNPNVLTFERSEQDKLDSFQNRLSNQQIRTSGALGGKRIGG